MDKIPEQNQRVTRTPKLVKNLLLVVSAAFFFGFALVPLYNIACEKVLGIKLAQEATAAEEPSIIVDTTRTITVQFDATVNSALNWSFKPKIPSMEVHPGELNKAWYVVSNPQNKPVVGHAVPSVAPNTASIFFNKTECFCFTEQMLAANETREMPVSFRIDPKLPKQVKTITLGYVFYLSDSSTQIQSTASGTSFLQ
jgi:cytochrome c oxidase assembly protein subunit 11